MQDGEATNKASVHPIPQRPRLLRALQAGPWTCGSPSLQSSSSPVYVDKFRYTVMANYRDPCREKPSLTSLSNALRALRTFHGRPFFPPSFLSACASLPSQRGCEDATQGPGPHPSTSPAIAGLWSTLMNNPAWFMATSWL